MSNTSENEIIDDSSEHLYDIFSEFSEDEIETVIQLNEIEPNYEIDTEIQLDEIESIDENYNIDNYTQSSDDESGNGSYESSSNESEDEIERNKIYNERINNAFFKLTQNIIHTFKFYYTEVDTIEELQHEVTVFLLEKLKKFNPEKGKAYSYFGTIAKRYLILYNNTNYKKLKSKAPLEDVDTDKTLLIEMSSASNQDTQLTKFLDKFTAHLDDVLFDMFPKDKELKVRFCLFRNIGVGCK
jgi:hypothetical protein